MKDSTCSRTKYGTILTTTLFWVAVWYLAYVLVGKEYIIPSPLHTLFLMAEMLLTSKFWLGVLWTLIRVVIGMFLSFASFASATASAGSEVKGLSMNAGSPASRNGRAYAA